MSAIALRLATHTRALHERAERSALMAALIRGELPIAAYRALLRNLQAIYRALEDELGRHHAHPALAPLRLAGLARGPSIASDLAQLAADGRAPDDTPLCAAALDHAAHLHALGRDAPQRLAAHAYVRYLGDLHGGQILGRIVADRLGAPAAFYDFGSTAQVEALKVDFRAGLDRLPLDEHGAQALLDEANDAFRRHIDLFDALWPQTIGAHR